LFVHERGIPKIGAKVRKLSQIYDENTRFLYFISNQFT